MTLCAWLVSFFGEDLIAQIDALVADIHAGTGNQLFDLLLALSAKRAGEINFASFAAAPLPGADVAVEFFLNGGRGHARVAEHTPGTRTRVKRQRREGGLGGPRPGPRPLGKPRRTLDRPPRPGRALSRRPRRAPPPRTGRSARPRTRPALRWPSGPPRPGRAPRPALAGAPRPPASRHLPPPYRQRNVVSVWRQAKLVTLDGGLFVPN